MKKEDKITIDNQPEYEDWECYIFGMHNGIAIRPLKGDLPNWFWRKMQYLVFGNIWKKLPLKKDNL